MTELSAWGNFYSIVGSAAGTLIGLQFVVLTLVATRPRAAIPAAGAAFASPTIVHFSVALLLSALLRAPWPSIAAPAVAWGIVGACGVGYATIVARRMGRQDAYRPEVEDWLFHFVLPAAAYGALFAAALASGAWTGGSLFAVGGATLVLLFVGIHNAWDAIAYHVFVLMQRE